MFAAGVRASDTCEHVCLRGVQYFLTVYDNEYNNDG